MYHVPYAVHIWYAPFLPNKRNLTENEIPRRLYDPSPEPVDRSADQDDGETGGQVDDDPGDEDDDHADQEGHPPTHGVGEEAAGQGAQHHRDHGQAD